jgi:hypothetical protein
MSECKCVMRGFCERHRVRKSDRMVKLCQTNDDYWRAWEEGSGPGQFRKLTDRQVKRLVRIQRNVLRDRRIMGWISFMRRPSDVGLGDALERLIPQASEKKELQTVLLRIQTRQSCSRSDATKQLNAKYPYMRNGVSGSIIRQSIT